MIEAVSIADESVGETSQINEAMPIGVVAGEPRCFKAEHEADVGERHFGGEPGKSGTGDGAGPREAKILINDKDALIRPTEFARLAGQGVLALRRLSIVLDLGGA